jgi:hypothetical protein
MSLAPLVFSMLSINDGFNHIVINFLVNAIHRTVKAGVTGPTNGHTIRVDPPNDTDNGEPVTGFANLRV